MPTIAEIWDMSAKYSKLKLLVSLYMHIPHQYYPR